MSLTCVRLLIIYVNLLVSKSRQWLIKIVRLLIQRVRILFYWGLSDRSADGRPILKQPLQIVGDGHVVFDGRVTIGCYPSPRFFNSYAYIEARNNTAEVVIGDGTWINNDFAAVAENASIRIGKRVLIGSNVEIISSDFHSTRVDERGLRDSGRFAPVLIEDEVFIGSNVRVLKGVTIGQGAVIANGAVVTKDIPPRVVAGGNPARVISIIK